MDAHQKDLDQTLDRDGMAEPAYRAHALLVAGMHRTGTSAMTRVLGFRGIDLPRDLIPGVTNDNDLGFWESAPITDAHDQFLASVGSAWDDVSPIPRSVFSSSKAQEFAAKLEQLLRAQYGSSTLFVVKDPRLCRLIPVWIEALERFGARPSFVITTRNPLEVAGSLRERNGFSATKSCLLWLRHVLDAERDSRGFPRVFVSYDHLLRDWVYATDRIARELHLFWPRSDHETHLHIEGFLSSTLRHHSFDYSELRARSDVTEWVKQIFEAVSQAATDTGEIDSDLFDEVRGDLDRADQAYGPLLAQARTETKARETSLEEARADSERLKGALEDQSREAEQLLGVQQQLQTRITELRSELEQLAVERDSWRTGVSEYEEDRDRWRERAESAEQELVMLNERLEAALAASTAADAQREGWERATEEARTAAAQLEAGLRIELEHLAAERDLLRATSGEREQDRDRWRERAESAEQARTSLNERLAEALAAAAAAEAQREGWERSSAEARASAGQLEARLLTELEQTVLERDNWRRTANDYEQDRNHWLERSWIAEQERASLNERLEAALAAAADVEEQRQAWERTIEDARASAEELATHLHAELQRLTLERDAWRRNANEREQDRNRWQGRAERAERERTDLNERLAAAHDAAAAAEAQRERWEIATEELRASAEQLEARLQAELENLALERDTWRTRATEQEQERDRWQERARSTERERESLNSQLEAALAAVAAVKLQHEDSQRAAAEARTATKLVEARLRAEVDELALEVTNWRRCASEYEQDRDRWLERAERAEQAHADLSGQLNALLAAVEMSGGFARRIRALSHFGSWLVRGRFGYLRQFFALRRSFDREAYLARNPDVAVARLHPLLHYIEHGAREGRAREDVPAEPLDTRAVRPEAGEADDDEGVSPPPSPAAAVAGELQETEHPQGEIDAVHHPESLLRTEPAAATPAPSPPTAAEEVRRRVHPGPEFEEFDAKIASGALPRAKAIAFYLPQFHAIPENDEWWGQGFTEWSNVARGYPRFADHYQPRLPRDLGFYDLSRSETLARQVDLARAAGIHGFSFYYYWFDGKRLLERPVERFLEDPTVDFPFCVTWANENWTRRWDGHDDEILIAQSYDPGYDSALVDDLQRHFADPRYIRLEGRPLLLLYRVDCIPDAARQIERWRELWQARHREEPLIFVAQAFGSADPRLFGLDGAFEFPPHKLVQDLPAINSQLTILDSSFRGHVVSYDDVVAEALAEPPPEYPLIRTAVPSWDNEARRQGAGLTLHGSTPAAYEHWLRELVKEAAERPVFGQPLVFLNAWNEWAEAAYLEPDVHYGSAYLNATARALRPPQAVEKRKVLFVGHDAHRHGAQINVWHMGDTMKNQFGCEVAYLLLDGGPMIREYEQLGRVWVADGDPSGIAAALAELQRDGFELAVTNTTLSGAAVPQLKAAGFRMVSLIHELPIIIGEFGGEGSLAMILEQSDTIVAPSQNVADALAAGALPDVAGRIVVRPQGLYKELDQPLDARSRLRSRLGIDEATRIVLNVGFGDLRKGVDTFVHVAKLAASRADDLHFVWLGNLHRDADRWLTEDLSGSIRGRVHFVPYDENVEDFYFGADAFFLSSREDPFPSVVLEAISAGLPVVGLGGTSGTEELIAEHGRLVDRDDLAGVVAALDEATREDDELARAARASVVAEQFRFDDYCFDLLRLLDPNLEKVSVVVPNYNYARHLDGRMRSIFEQTYPVFETLVLDDCSTDDSLDRLDDIARATGRRFRLVANDENSGSPFAQWERGCRLARGKYVWVAEADDSSDARFLEEVVLALGREAACFAFSDSVPIDEEGVELADSYQEYYREAVGSLMDSSFALDGKTFVDRCLAERNLVLNASAVVWDRAALVDALAACRDVLKEYRLAGDWHLYSAVALREGRVAFIASPLNIHRRHDSSVTATLNANRHVEEVERVQAFIAATLGADDVARGRMQAYADSLRDQFGVLSPETRATNGDSAVSVLESSALEVARDWVESAYYDDAENAMEGFWGEGSPFLELFRRLDLTAVAEVACGHGRHAEHIAEWVGSLVVTDIHESNVDFCRTRLAEHENVEFVVNNGYDLQPLAESSLTAIFCYDAMVHFPGEVIDSYLRDTARVLCAGGMALYHHSNYDAPDDRHYGLNPHARNRMTRERFGELARAAGLEVVESRILDWGGVPNLDCLTLLRRPEKP